MITSKERIERARATKKRLEKMRDMFLVIAENPNVSEMDKMKAVFYAYEIERSLIEDKFLT